MKKNFLFLGLALGLMACNNATTEIAATGEEVSTEASAEFSIQGDWLLKDIDVQLTNEVPEEQKAMMEQMFTMMKELMIGKMTMNFGAEGNFTAETPNPMTNAMEKREGVYELIGNQLITSETANGTTLSDTVDLVFNGAEEFSFSSNEAEGSMKMTFEKK